MPIIGTLFKYSKIILPTLALIGLAWYIYTLRSTIESQARTIKLCKAEIIGANYDIERLSKVNKDNLDTIKQIEDGCDARVDVCYRQNEACTHKGDKLLQLIEALKRKNHKLENKPATVVYHLEKCEVKVEEDTNTSNDQMLKLLNETVGGE